MKKIFVFTDNKFIFESFNSIIEKKNGLVVDYYCSPSSQSIFDFELQNGLIFPIKLSQVSDEFISQYDLGISCHSKQIFPKRVVDSVICINIHPGLNPYNRGWYPQVFSLINGLPAGATIHIMDDKVDHGPIIAQREVAVYPTDTSADVYNRVQKVEVELLEENLNNILNGRFSSKLPNSEGNYNSINDFKQLKEIPLDKLVTMKEALNYFRAMTHPPYKNSFFISEDGEKIFVEITLSKDVN